MKYVVTIFVIVICDVVNFADCQRCAFTNGSGPKKNAPCVFPFLYRRQVSADVHYICKCS
jgi:hypothetical protein